jgi:hypothetical protein
MALTWVRLPDLTDEELEAQADPIELWFWETFTSFRRPSRRGRTSMAKFEVGDRVRLSSFVLPVVEVLELGTCEDGPDCELGVETFRFKDPGGLGDDWAHTSEFERV